MDFFDMVNISERFMEIVNPTSAHKLLRAGEIAGMRKGQRVIDFGCGYAEALVLWAREFGISGIGIDIREHACERARKKIAANELNGKLEIRCGKGSEFKFEPGSYDFATAIGSTFVWDGFRATLRALREAIKPDGKLMIGEAFLKTDHTPAEYHLSSVVPKESEIPVISREEGFDIEFVIPASQDDWDNYETGNWRALINWIETNPEHPERQQVIDHLHNMQDEYFAYQRKYVGWAIFILNPARY
jgi:ubiquinone/menaquinone biosynthesis C-methylase UbiE